MVGISDDSLSTEIVCFGNIIRLLNQNNNRLNDEKQHSNIHLLYHARSPP